MESSQIVSTPLKMRVELAAVYGGSSDVCVGGGERGPRRFGDGRRWWRAARGGIDGGARRRQARAAASVWAVARGWRQPRQRAWAVASTGGGPTAAARGVDRQRSGRQHRQAAAAWERRRRQVAVARGLTDGGDSRAIRRRQRQGDAYKVFDEMTTRDVVEWS
ncbi:hypothetical protein OsI_38833 [Oryza sativa Indica Group]|uniref:Uncharacterized protein n=1 Tax=Oryza sativa subsp. indica TaxID=39946 RepID=B8BMM5_ORYSI|nr:hypothetical protein OsI_38833 [Oryza sativa Indica Group]